MSEPRKRVAILISGRGSNMSALIDAARAPDYPAQIVGVFSNQPNAEGLKLAAAHGIADGSLVRLGNPRGAVTLHARHFDGVRRGVLVSEGLWPNAAFVDGQGINTLTGADPVAPYGGAAFHDNRVWIAAA